MSGINSFLVVVLVLWLFISIVRWVGRARMSPAERAAEQRAEDARRTEDLWGARNPALVCPHCQTPGLVRAKPVQRKKGISGAKATGALLTGGVSMLATGLSRKEGATQAHCERCNSTWDF